jgi:integrase
MARKRRGRGEGLIRERLDGSWEARVSLGYDNDGKRITRSVYGKTKGEVQDKLRKLQNDAAGGQLAEPATITVGQYLESWLKDTAKPKCSPTTFARYESLVHVHITPHIGSIKLAKLQPVQINYLMGEIARDVEDRNNGRSPAWSQRLSLMLLSNALRHAVRLRLIPYNPAADIPKAKPREKEIEFLTAEQGKKFLAAAKKKRLYALFAVALGTGMRQGEIFALRWDAIDFERKQLTVRHSLVELRGGVFSTKEPKSKQSRRTIKLPDFVITALKAHKKAMTKEGHHSPFCFTTKTGKHISKSNLTRQVFRVILKAAKLPRVKFHALRHSHASMLLHDGASIKAVSQRLGHSTVELTLRVYFHLLPDADDSLAGMTEKLFR